jgi:4,5-DOPA dioxygenase extradiol
MNAQQPVLFVGHGSPMMALQPGAAGAAMHAVAQRLPTPRAVLVISPHWETLVPTVGTAAQMATIHDFGGFDERLYQMQYPAPGEPALAERVVQLLQAADLPVKTDAQHGLDHGAWIPLQMMYPQAHIPVVPLSIQHALGPGHAYRVGQALAPLAQEGVLLLCSGNITHNMRDWHMMMNGIAVPPYAEAFSDWVHSELSAGRHEALLGYRQPQSEVHALGLRAHPRDEHFLPLFSAMGAAGESANAQAFHRGISDHVFAMDAYIFTPQGATP